MDLDQIRETLFQAMDDQYAADKAALEESQKIGQQKIMYSNDARGTLYSGQPTWDRSQLVAQGVQNLSNLNEKYMNNKLNTWNKITDILDKINSYNKAAAALSKATKNTVSGTSNGTSLLDLYNGM